MALNPDKKGTIKDVVDKFTYDVERFENYIDRCILLAGPSRPLQINFGWNSVPDNEVIKELQARYLRAGWVSFQYKYSRDSRGDSYCDIELR